MYSRRAIAYSVLLHVALVVVLTVSIDFTPDALRPVAEPREIVQAVAVDRQAVDAELERLEAEEERARLEREESVREAERKAQAAEEKRKAEERRLKELEAEKQRQTEKREMARKAEEQRKADEAKRKAEEQRKAEEAKRKAEEEQRRAEEEQRKAEQEKRKAEAAAREAERKRIEQALQDELAAEEAARQAAAQEAADASEINRYVAAIAQRVRQSYTILPGFDGLSCTVRIALIPGGEVAKVEIVKSSGNPTFDRQAENAVRKAAPLPVPTEPRLFQKMRSITFVFDPQS